MERIVRGRSATLTKTFYADGVPTDPTGSPTVTVTRSDGTAVTTGAVTDEAAAGTWSVTIPATSNTLLDTLTVDWAATVNGVSQEHLDTVEVAGDVLFTISEFRALGSAYANTTNYPTATVADIRTTVEQALEDACGVAFVPRYTLQTLSGTGGSRLTDEGLIGPYWTGTRPLTLRWPMIRSIRSVTVDDVAVTTIADVGYTEHGIVYYPWSAGFSNVVIGYEHGHDTPPARIRRAALILAKRWITPGSADDRAINVTNDTGTYALFQAGVRGHLFDVPEVQAAVDQYNLRAGVA